MGLRQSLGGQAASFACGSLRALGRLQCSRVLRWLGLAGRRLGVWAISVGLRAASGRGILAAAMAESSVANRAPLTPLSLLERTVRVFPHKTALVYGDVRRSYAEFADDVGRLAGALQRAGITFQTRTG